jgi:hypothetical protein
MDSENRCEPVKLTEAASYLLEECRMVLPGIQAIFGFQLIAVFNQRFSEDLERSEQALHFIAMSLVAIAVAMVMCPAAYQRMSAPMEVSERFLRNSSRLLVGSMVALGCGLALDYYLIGRLVFDTAWVALPTAGLLVVLSFFWFVFPKSRTLQSWLDRKPFGGTDHSVG